MKLLDSDKKYAYLYTFLLIILLSIPIYFVISLAYENEILSEKIKIKDYLSEVEYNLNKEDFHFRSVRYKLAIFDENLQLQRSNLSNKLNNYNFKVLVIYPYLYYKKDIYKNNISFIVSEIKIDYSKIFLLGAILFFIVLLNIYLLNKGIIRNATKSYEIIQKYTNILFNNAMHELKTPIGIININLDLLARKDESNKYIKRIKIALKQMQVNYESVEYYIKNKKVKYIKEKIDFSSYLLKRVDFFEDIAQVKNIQIQTQIDREIFIFMSVEELQKIIDNTLMNAIKYSSANNKIEVRLYLDNIDKCILFIKDYGYGIKDVKNIFKRYVRENEVQGGFGLGLNIVKTICDKNNIHINLKSKEDIGSTFIYKFDIYKTKILDNLK